MSYKNAHEESKAFISKVKSVKNGSYAIGAVNRIINKASQFNLSIPNNRVAIAKAIQAERDKNDTSEHYSPHLSDFLDILENELYHDWA